ncbi:MAG: glycosyltransferase family 4 protein [Planctomycetes bacterium]|nr:glycosyltransferase family 4 protein [Planctomycetota bacterium]
MRILIINYMETMASGGINIAVRETARYLSRAGHDVIIIQANPLSYPDEETYEGVKITRIRSRLGKYTYDLTPKMYFSLRRHIKHLDPDIIHIHGYHNLLHIAAIFAIRTLALDIPMVFSPHFGTLSHDSRGGKYLWKTYNTLIGKRSINYPDAIVSASIFEARNLEDVFNVPKNRITVIPHGVKYLETKETESTKRHKSQLLYAGYLLELKGIHHIIEAFHKLIHSGNDVSLTIIGEGPYKNTLIGLAEQLNVNDSITWVDFLSHDKLLEKLRNASIFLLLSASENYGIVVAEALAMGTPVIVTRTTALEEFIDEPGCFGVDYPPDPNTVANFVKEVIDNGVKVGPFSHRIRTWDKVTEDYENLYQQLIAC